MSRFNTSLTTVMLICIALQTCLIKPHSLSFVDDINLWNSTLTFLTLNVTSSKWIFKTQTWMRRNNACTSITLYVHLHKSMFSSDRGNGDNTFMLRHQNLTLALLGPNFRQTLSQRFSSSNLVFSKYLICNLNYSLIPSSSNYLVSHANSRSG